MWCLPNILRLNSEAASNKRKFERAVRTGKLDGKKILCEHADYDGGNCSGPVSRELWFDIFSDNPKGILAQCEYHRDHCGTPEGYFYCSDCDRTMVTNYTWELYRAVVDGEVLCLPCACKRYIADPENWITLTTDIIEAFDFEQMRKAKHVIGVEMPVPDEIRFLDNCEFDSSDGHQISGEPIQSILESARERRYTKALLIRDAAYQFAVSFGVYVGRDEYFKVNPDKAPRRAKWRQKPKGERRLAAVGGVA
jgi:hypothetical protein